jgi:hypothetical protein
MVRLPRLHGASPPNAKPHSGVARRWGKQALPMKSRERAVIKFRMLAPGTCAGLSGSRSSLHVCSP